MKCQLHFMDLIHILVDILKYAIQKKAWVCLLFVFLKKSSLSNSLVFTCWSLIQILPKSDLDEAWK